LLLRASTGRTTLAVRLPAVPPGENRRKADKQSVRHGKVTTARQAS